MSDGKAETIRHNPTITTDRYGASWECSCGARGRVDARPGASGSMLASLRWAAHVRRAAADRVTGIAMDEGLED